MFHQLHHRSVLASYFLAVLFFSTTHAASFNCASAKSSVEHQICSSSDLYFLDEKMANLYLKYIYSAHDADQMRNSQRLWLKNIRDRCTTLDCLSSAYIARVKLLTDKTNELPQPAVCATIAKYANEEKLSGLGVKPDAGYDDAKKLLFGPGELHGDLASLWRVNIGKGRKPVYVGEFHAQQIYPTLYIRAVEKNGKLLTIDGKEFDYGTGRFDLLRIEGRYYVLGAAQFPTSLPTKLWGITDDLRLAEVCTFRPNPKPLVKLVKGFDKSVCKAAEAGEGSYTPFSGGSQIKLQHEPRFRGMVPTPGAAFVDIDNDGKQDRVIRLDFAVGNGRECDSRLLAVTDEQGIMIPDNNVNRLLRQVDECVPSGKDSIGVFALNGTNYIDAKGWFGNRSVYLVTPDHLDTVCKFSGRTLTEVSQ